MVQVTYVAHDGAETTIDATEGDSVMQAAVTSISTGSPSDRAATTAPVSVRRVRCRR